MASDESINFPSLIRRYIAHLLDAEGADFIRDMSADDFSQQEISWMQHVSLEEHEKMEKKIEEHIEKKISDG